MFKRKQLYLFKHRRKGVTLHSLNTNMLLTIFFMIYHSFNNWHLPLQNNFRATLWWLQRCWHMHQSFIREHKTLDTLLPYLWYFLCVYCYKLFVLPKKISLGNLRNCCILSSDKSVGRLWFLRSWQLQQVHMSAPFIYNSVSLCCF